MPVPRHAPASRQSRRPGKPQPGGSAACGPQCCRHPVPMIISGTASTTSHNISMSHASTCRRLLRCANAGGTDLCGVLNVRHKPELEGRHQEMLCSRVPCYQRIDKAVFVFHVLATTKTACRYQRIDNAAATAAAGAEAAQFTIQYSRCDATNCPNKSGGRIVSLPDLAARQASLFPRQDPFSARLLLTSLGAISTPEIRRLATSGPCKQTCSKAGKR